MMMPKVGHARATALATARPASLPLAGTRLHVKAQRGRRAAPYASAAPAVQQHDTIWFGFNDKGEFTLLSEGGVWEAMARRAQAAHAQPAAETEAAAAAPLAAEGGGDASEARAWIASWRAQQVPADAATNGAAAVVEGVDRTDVKAGSEPAGGVAEPGTAAVVAGAAVAEARTWISGWLAQQGSEDSAASNGAAASATAAPQGSGSAGEVVEQLSYGIVTSAIAEAAGLSEAESVWPVPSIIPVDDLADRRDWIQRWKQRQL